jgi:hypothetical protein
MENSINEKSKPKRNWFPQTKTAKWAVGFALATIVLGVLLPSLTSLPFVGGREAVITEIILTIVSLVLSIKAIFGQKDRSILLLIIFVLLCLIGGFWLFFAVGEIISPT